MMALAALESRRRLEQPVPLELRALLEEVCASASFASAPRRIDVQLRPGDDAIVLGDAVLLRRAVSKLLVNALDFAPAGSVVTVELQLQTRRVDVVVRDQGAGIPDYADDKVFEGFYSLPRPNTQRKSTGLGLSFVREIAALHDGRASLRNAPEGGAVASLSLPRVGNS